MTDFLGGGKKYYALVLILLILVFAAGIKFGDSGAFQKTASLIAKTFSPNERLIAEMPLRDEEENDLAKTIFYQSGKNRTGNQKNCSFSSFSSPEQSDILINEVAWMGDSAGFANEWIELKNFSGEKISIAGWQILDKDEQIKIIFPSNSEIDAHGFYFLERQETAVPEIKADVLYSGNLKNSDEGLRFFNNHCVLLDEAIADPNWPAGDNKNKFTMERNPVDLSWYTSSVQNGTPRKNNSEFKTTEVKTTAQNISVSETTTIQISENTTQTEPPPQNVSPLPAIQLNPVLVSEVMAGTEANGVEDEFVELYNPSDNPINLLGWSLKKKTVSGKEYNLVSTGSFSGTIPAKGFFLITHKNYKGAVSADLIYSANSQNLAYTENSLYLYKSDGTVADSVFWTEIPAGQSLERVSWTQNSFQIQALPNPRGSQ